MAGYLGVDTATGEVPILGDAVDFFFQGHLLAAKALQAEMEQTHWIEAREADAKASGEHERHMEVVARDPQLKRGCICTIEGGGFR